MREIRKNIAAVVVSLVVGALLLVGGQAFGDEEAVEGKQLPQAPESICPVTPDTSPQGDESETDDFDALCKKLCDKFTRLAVDFFSGNAAHLLAENQTDLLARNKLHALSDNKAELLSGNCPNLLSGNKTSMRTGKSVSVLSDIKVEINININSGNKEK
jgi:hypothetical protein